MKKRILTLALVIVVIFGISALPAFAADPNYKLTWRSDATRATGGNPVYAAWNGGAGELTVTYTSSSNYFALRDMTEAQGSKLLKANASGVLQEVSGVTSQIISTGDTRSGTNYGTVVLKFYSGGSLYSFESGVSYGVLFDIIANGYHHSSPSDADPFMLVGTYTGATTATTPAPTAPAQQTPPSTATLAANPTASTVYVNGAAKAFEAYIINGNNYFKLRDLAYVMNGTAKQFEVGYDSATKAITLTTGKAYTPDGGEMAKGDGRAKTASPTASRIYLNGKELNLTVYLIGGNNFFKLRDLMEAIDVFVGYDNATKAITL